TGASPMISSAIDVTCSVVKKGASAANVAVKASDKVVFIIRMNARLPNVTTFKSNVTTFMTNVTSSRAAPREALDLSTTSCGTNQASSGSNVVTFELTVITFELIVVSLDSNA